MNLTFSLFSSLRVFAPWLSASSEAGGEFCPPGNHKLEGYASE
jgi:hypothetical protein